MVYVPFNPDSDTTDFDHSSGPIRDYPTNKQEYEIEVVPSQLEFAQLPVGQTSTAVPITIINTGFRKISVINVNIVGPFILVGSVPNEIEPGETGSFSVAYQPKATGDETGGVYINTGDAAGPEFVTLLGSASSGYIANLGTDIIKAWNAGDGTANVIQAVTDNPVPAANGKVLIALNITTNNTGAATVRFNNDTPLNVKEADGTDPESSDLVAGTIHLGYILDGTFRLLTDNASAALYALISADVTAAEADRVAAEAARDRSENAADASEAIKLQVTDMLDAIGADVKFYDTYAEAEIDLTILNNLQVVEIFNDENFNNARTRYRVEDEELIFKYIFLEEVTPELFGAKGDGVTNDIAAINAAIATGKSVLFSGNYLIANAIVIFNDNQKLYSLNNATITQTLTDANTIQATNLDNLIISGLNIEAIGTMTSISNGAGIGLFGCTNCKIINNNVSNHRGYGVLLQNSDDCSILDNTFTNSPVVDSDLHTQTTGDIAVLYSGNRNIIQGNKCFSGNGVGITVQAIETGNECRDNIIIDNIIRNTKIYGIMAYRIDSLIDPDCFRGTIIANNTIDNITGSIEHATQGFVYGAGIYVQGAEDTLVEGNSVFNTHSFARTFVDTLTLAAIGATNVGNITIRNNYIKSPNKDGIQANDATDLGVATGWAVIEENTIEGALRNGVRIGQRGKVKIGNNNIINSTDRSIRIQNTVAETDFDITGNHIVGGTYGIEANFANDLIIHDNVIKTTSVHGISVANGANLEIYNNYINGAVTRGIDIASTITSGTVKDNTIRGASTVGIQGAASGVAIHKNDINGPTTDYAGTYPLWRTLTPDTASPAVGLHEHWLTANTVSTTYINFTGAKDGQEIEILVRDANSIFDFSGTNLKGNAAANVNGAVGDRVVGIYNRGLFNWFCTINKVA